MKFTPFAIDIVSMCYCYPIDGMIWLRHIYYALEIESINNMMWNLILECKNTTATNHI